MEQWPRCPEAAGFLEQQLSDLTAAEPVLEQLTARLLEAAGVRLFNLVDHFALPASSNLRNTLSACGLQETRTSKDESVWEHPGARLPRVRVQETLPKRRLAIAVEDVDLFVRANNLHPTRRQGEPDSGYEELSCPLASDELAVVARRGYRGFQPQPYTRQEAEVLQAARQSLRTRSREGCESAIIQEARQRLDTIASQIGQARAVDEFFAAEREYYMSRNQAARWQYHRQQQLGIGWANHDHHTYRSSRSGFGELIQFFLSMGFEQREKFYAGREAGWGAQILEHPVSRVVIFADVDMAVWGLGPWGAR